MIEYVKGELAELAPAQAIIECHGVGYALGISLNTYSSIQGKHEVKLFVYEVIREDTYALYGFASKDERSLFLLLISVSGIGGNTARTILSAFTPRELCDLITSENDKMLKSVKGIGLKTAQRIIVELKDKLPAAQLLGGASTLTNAQGTALDNEKLEEAVAALTMLGFSPAPTQKVVLAILEEEPALAVEMVIKKALKMM